MAVVPFRFSEVEGCEVKNIYWSNYWSGSAVISDYAAFPQDFSGDPSQ